MTGEQLQLGFRNSASLVDKADLARFTNLLESQTKWISARELMRITGWDDCFVRLLAQHSNGAVIGGNKGYRLTRLATEEEMKACVGQLRHQAESMEDRAIKIERVYRASLS